jgi:glyceraldehyde-3-phosphate dehydrogenase (NAD(P))
MIAEWSMIKCLLVGYGSQGIRIAEAISAQPDLELFGIGLKVPDVFARMAFKRGHSIYAMNDEDISKFKEAGMDVQGTISESLPQTDVVVDATPSGVGRKNKEEFYSKYKVKSIFQAGEALEVADVPAFISIINYDEAKKSNSVRIPSPFTVSLVRSLKPMDDVFGVKSVICGIIRPGSEPMKGHYGPVDTITLDKPYGEHSVIYREMRCFFPKNFLFTSLAIPSILLAVEIVIVDLEREVSAEQVIELLAKTPRVILVKSDDGLHSTDAIFEYIRRTARPSADVYELCVWYEHIEASNHRLTLVQAFDPHCIQTPEVIDAIRALCGVKEKEESLNQTNKALKLLDPGIYP